MNFLQIRQLLDSIHESDHAEVELAGEERARYLDCFRQRERGYIPRGGHHGKIDLELPEGTKPVYSIDRGMIRRGFEVKEDDESVRFCGLCLTNCYPGTD